MLRFLHESILLWQRKCEDALYALLYNFHGTNKPDPSIDPDFLNQLRTQCGDNQTSVSPSLSPYLSPSPSAATSPSSTTTLSEILAALLEEPGMRMDYEGRGSSYGTLYYAAFSKAGVYFLLISRWQQGRNPRIGLKLMPQILICLIRTLLRQWRSSQISKSW